MINNLYSDLLSEIGVSNNVTEIDKDSVIRVCVSAAAKNAYYSLWDQMDGDITIEHFKDRIKASLLGFKKLFPLQLSWVSKDTVEEISNNIYKYYLYCGLLYHSPKRITASMRKACGLQGTFLVRSPKPAENVLMSGIGFYCLEDSQPNSLFSEVFHTNSHSLSEMYDYIKHLDYSKSNQPENAVYLRTKPPYNKGYWQKELNLDVEYGILRLESLNKEYYLYHLNDGMLEIHRIPEKLAENGEYREYSCAILKHENTYPAIEYEESREYIKIRFSYLLPAKLQKLIEMYSWGFIYPENIPYNRIMKKEVFHLFEQQLKQMGYVFEEKRS